MRIAGNLWGTKNGCFSGLACNVSARDDESQRQSQCNGLLALNWQKIKQTLICHWFYSVLPLRDSLILPAKNQFEVFVQFKQNWFF